MTVTFSPIGHVKTGNGRYFIELEEKHLEAALGVDEFSHIQVLWWANLYDSPEARNYLVLDKPYKKGPDKIGVLATRSPVRPNPIGVTACALISVDRASRCLEVAYIDAEDGTPVLDIKPYEPAEDRVRDVVMPAWCRHWPSCLEESADFDWYSEFNF
jgi:tRNA-Thr(GGU) m(6)t(6)A37 methyltransferase TsaA